MDDAQPFDPVRRRRGGRRRLPEGERRDAVLAIRLPDIERRAIIDRAKAAGLSLSDFGRAALQGASIRVNVVRRAPPELIQQLRAMGNNLNQAIVEARRGHFPASTAEAAEEAMRIISTELRNLLHDAEHRQGPLV